MEAKKTIFEQTEERNLKLLELRAKRLAERTDAESQRQDESVLIFCLAEERFAVRMTAVSAVLPLAKLTPVPNTDPKILGIMPVKGEAHCIFDFRQFLELGEESAEEASASKHVLILRLKGHRLGLCVDRIEAIDYLDGDAPMEPLQSGAVGRSYVKLRSKSSLVLIDQFTTLLSKFIHGEKKP